MNAMQTFLKLLQDISLHVVVFAGILWLAVFLRKTVGARLLMTKMPNVLFPIASGVKILSKQRVFSHRTARVLFFATPVIAFLLVPFLFLCLSLFTTGGFAFVPFGVPYALFVLYLGLYAFVLSGLSTKSRFALIGAVRGVMRLLSVQLVLFVIAMIVMLGAHSTDVAGIVQAQKKVWFVFVHFPVAVIFAACALFLLHIVRFETPFAQKEIASGVYGEYSGAPYLFLRWANYVLCAFMALLGTILFLGGHNAPFSWDFFSPEAWLAIKTAIVFCFFVLGENILPDERSDDLFLLAFSGFLPFCTVWLTATAGVCLFWGGAVS